MKKMFFTLILGLTVIFSAKGINLIGNGGLTGEGDCPSGWVNKSRMEMIFQNNGGPNGAGMITFSNPGNEKKTVQLRQIPFTLVPGEKYRVSVRVKTTGFKANKMFIGIHNYGWRTEDGIHALPADTEDWKLVSAEFKLSNSQRRNMYGFVIQISQMTGTLSIGDIQLIPLTEKAEKESKGMSISGEAVSLFITPMVPRLAALPAGTAEIPFAWVQRSHADAVLRCTIDQKHTVDLKVRNKRFTLPLPVWARVGSHDLYTVLAAKDGRKLMTANFRFGFAAQPPKAAVKRFNNLMSEVLNASGGRKSYEFVNPRDGWVYFRTEGTPRTTVRLYGSSDPVILPEYYRSENQRFLKAGKYTLTLDQPVSGRVIVRLVPVIYKYGPIKDPVGFSEAGKFDLEYHKKHVFGVCNFIGKLNRNAKEVKARGIEWSQSFGPYSTTPFSAKSQREMTGKMNASPFFRNPGNSWVEFDEYYWSNAFSMLMCARSYDGLKNPHGKKVFNWIAGPADFAPEQMHYDIISRFFNVSGGNGYLAYEAYLRPMPTEKEAEAYVRDYYDRSLKFTDTVSLNSRPYTGFMLGNFQLITVLSLDHKTDVDYRYYLDLQLNILAKDPKYSGLGMIGFWGCHYTDQELNDWCYALLRHYVIEGRTDMLSSKYGYTYKLSHLKDGDFQRGLAAWKASGNVKAGKLTGYGRMQCRYSAPSDGDTFALFAGVQGKRNQLSQTMTGLVPGKPYKLYYAVGDHQDCTARKNRPRDLELECVIEGAKIDRRLHYAAHPEHKGKGTLNLNCIFFTPTKTEHTLTFRDSGMRAGEQLMLNFVKITQLYIPD